MGEMEAEMTFEDAEDLLEELEEGGRKSLRMKLLNVERYQTEAMVRAVVERAVESRRRNPERCLFYADLAVDLSKKIRGEGTAAIQARALAERANALRIGEQLEEAADVMLQAECKHREGVGADWPEFLLARAALQKDLGQFEAAAIDAEAGTAGYATLGDSLRQTVGLVLVGQIKATLGDFERAQSALDEAIRRLKGDLWDPKLLVAAYVNSVHNLIELVGNTQEPERRASHLGQAYLALAQARPFVQRFGNEDDMIQLDWLSGRTLFLDGKLIPAEQLYCSLLWKLVKKGKKLRAAVLGLDLCRVLLWQGNLEIMQQMATYCARTFAGAELTDDLWVALRYLETARNAAEADALIVRTLEKCGARNNGAPQGFALSA